MLTEGVSFFELSDPVPYLSWFDKYEKYFLNLLPEVCQNTSRWFDLFKQPDARRAAGNELVGQLYKVRAQLGDIVEESVDDPSRGL